MPLPLVPLAIAAVIVLAAAGTKKKKKGGIVQPPTPDEGEIYAFVLGDFPEDEPLALDIMSGDMVRFDFETMVGPHGWALFSEAIDGDPIIGVEEEFIAPGVDAPPGTPGVYRADLLAHESQGTVQLDFMLMETDVENPEVLEAKQVLLRIV